MIIEYPKIQTLFNRDKKSFKVIVGDYRLPVFKTLEEVPWVVTEKVDGTNVRIILTEVGYEYRGRTDRAVFNREQSEFLEKVARDLFEKGVRNKILFGELFGSVNGKRKIGPNGDKYSREYRITFFDIWDLKNGAWFELSEAKQIVESNSYEFAPIIGTMRIPDIVELVREGFPSQVSEQPLTAEGVVARTNPQLYYHDKPRNRYMRAIFKLKTRDFHKK